MRACEVYVYEESVGSSSDGTYASMQFKVQLSPPCWKHGALLCLFANHVEEMVWSAGLDCWYFRVLRRRRAESLQLAV